MSSSGVIKAIQVINNPQERIHLYPNAVSLIRELIGDISALEATIAQQQAEIVRLTAQLDGTEQTCPHCDGTGDVHGIDGEWRGECTCGAQPDKWDRIFRSNDVITQYYWPEGVYRPGHVHMPEYGARMVHIPTGVVVECHQHDSRFRNVAVAMNRLQQTLIRDFGMHDPVQS